MDDTAGILSFSFEDEGRVRALPGFSSQAP